MGGSVVLHNCPGLKWVVLLYYKLSRIEMGGSFVLQIVPD